MQKVKLVNMQVSRYPNNGDILEIIQNCYDYTQANKPHGCRDYLNITDKVVTYDDFYIYEVTLWCDNKSVNLRSIKIPSELVKNLSKIDYQEYIMIVSFNIIVNPDDLYDAYMADILDIVRISKSFIGGV